MNAPRFNQKALRELFYAWHGGQDSALYAAASSGLVDDVSRLQYEIRQDAAWLMGEPSNAKFPNENPTRTQAKEATRLRFIADALPGMLSKPFTHSHDGRVYRALSWAAEGPMFVPVAVRREKATGHAGLFFYEGPDLTCYFRIGQHSQASIDYMQNATTRADASDPDCAALLREWEGLGPVGVYARIVKRLTN